MTTAVVFKPTSLLDRIKKTENSDELLSLEIEGAGYEYASDKTRRRWTMAITIIRKKLSQTTKRLRNNSKLK